jgi:Peptidase family M48
MGGEDDRQGSRPEVEGKLYRDARYDDVRCPADGKNDALQRAPFRWWRVLPPPQAPLRSAFQRGWVGGRSAGEITPPSRGAAGAVIAATALVASVSVLAGGVAAHAVRLLGVASGCAFSVRRHAHRSARAHHPSRVRPRLAHRLHTRGCSVPPRAPLAPLAATYPVEGVDLAAIARTTGISLDQTPAAQPAAFCFGLLRPQVVLTSGLIDQLSDEERAAAFWHEVQHARVREPLRALLARLIASTFFWLPALRDLFERYTLVRELDADRLAQARTSHRALAGALHAVAAGPRFAGSVGFAGLADSRVDRLLDPRAPLPSLFHRSRLALSLAALDRRSPAVASLRERAAEDDQSSTGPQRAEGADRGHAAEAVEDNVDAFSMEPAKPRQEILVLVVDRGCAALLDLRRGRELPRFSPERFPARARRAPAA